MGKIFSIASTGQTFEQLSYKRLCFGAFPNNLSLMIGSGGRSTPNRAPRTSYAPLLLLNNKNANRLSISAINRTIPLLQN